MEDSAWGSDVPLLVWQLVLGLLAWERGVSGAFRATCSGWQFAHDALFPRLELEPGSTTTDEWMRGRWGRFPSVATVKLWLPTATFLPLLPELQSLPALTKLQLVFQGWMRASDMQALAQSLPKLSSLSIADRYDSEDEGGDEYSEEVEGDEVVGLSELSSLQSLTTLKFWSGSRSLVSREGLAALKGLTGLHTLQLSWPGAYKSTVTNTELGALSSLTGLTSLVIGGCPAVTDLGALSTLTHLSVLNLQHFWNLPDAGMRVLANLNTLTEIILCGCQLVADEGVREMARLPALSSLMLDSQHVTDKGLRMLSGCVTLTRLTFGMFTVVTNEGLRALRTLKSLTELTLFSNSKVTAEGLRTLSVLPVLATISLRDCSQVADEEVHALSGVTALTEIDLINCSKVTNDGLQALRTLPVLRKLHIGTFEDSTKQATACLLYAGGEQLRRETIAPALEIVYGYTPRYITYE